MSEEKTTISRQTFGRLRRAIIMFLTSDVGKRARFLVAMLMLLMLCINGMNVVNSYVGRYFMSAIERRDSTGFSHYAWVYGGVFAASTVVAAFFRFTEERLGLLWRDWMTRSILAQYIDERIYLHIEESKSISNPDQRIAEDIRSMTVTTLSFVLMILNSTVTVISFAGVLWDISPELFLISVVYAVVGSGLTIWLGRPLIRLNYRQLDFEANFRSELLRVRENAEGIAFSGSEARTKEELLQRLTQLVENFRRITSINRNLNFFTTGYNYMIQLIPTLIVAPIFIRRGVEFGIIGQSAMAFATIVAALSLIVTQYQSISAYASVVARLGELVEASDKAMQREGASCIGCSMTSDQFTYENLSLRSNDEEQRLLLKSLNVSFPSGKRVLVTGPNEAAKVALFRASAGRYDTGDGVILRPRAGQVAFLTEQPYIPPGTLREVLLPAGSTEKVTDEALKSLLQEIGLGQTLSKHDGIEDSQDWHDLLSLGEQQLMAFARAILSNIQFAFLDRPHTSLSRETLKRVLQFMAKRNITCISFGDGPPDHELHDACLELKEDASWKWSDSI